MPRVTGRGVKRLDRSKELFEEAQRYIPGGVNSPVRALKAVGGYPPFIKRGLGSRIYDEDDNEFIDYVCSWGPLILGHSHPHVSRALSRIIRKKLLHSYLFATEARAGVVKKLVENNFSNFNVAEFQRECQKILAT